MSYSLTRIQKLATPVGGFPMQVRVEGLDAEKLRC